MSEPKPELEVIDRIREIADQVGANRRTLRDSDRPVSRQVVEDGRPVPENIIHERQSTHGTFEDNARISQELKDVFRAQPGWSGLTFVERESMDNIALKFSRMLSGRSSEVQHWEDVVGYGKLALNQAQGKPCNA